jgi:hypothetical protein
MLALAMGSVMPIAANADDYNITFKARILETTCDMTINGSDSSATILIGDAGKVSMGDIISHRNDATTAGPSMAGFSLEIKECPSSIGGIKTTITGSFSGYDPSHKTIVGSQSGDAAPPSTGIRFSRSIAPTDYFTIFAAGNTSDVATEVIKWSPDEITAGKVNLLARLVPTSDSRIGSMEPGAVHITATFNFEYE